MSLVAWKTITCSQLIFIDFGTTFANFLEWLMKRALFPQILESTLWYLVSLKVQKRLFSTKVSLIFSRLLLSMISPRYFITNSPLKMNSPANRPRPAFYIFDFPILVNLLRCMYFSLFWHQLAPFSLCLQSKQPSHTSGRQRWLFLKQGHLFYQQLLSDLHLHPFLFMSQSSEQPQEGRQYPRIWQSHERQVISVGYCPRKQWKQIELYQSSHSIFLAVLSLFLIIFLWAAEAKETKSLFGSFSKNSVSSSQNLNCMRWGKLYSCTKQQKICSHELSLELFFIPFERLVFSKIVLMSQGLQLNSYMPIFTSDLKMGEYIRFFRSILSCFHLSPSSLLKQCSEQKSVCLFSTSPVMKRNCWKSLCELFFRFQRRCLMSYSCMYWKLFFITLAGWQCLWQSQVRQMEQKSCLKVFEMFSSVISYPLSIEMAKSEFMWVPSLSNLLIYSILWMNADLLQTSPLASMILSRKLSPLSNSKWQYQNISYMVKSNRYFLQISIHCLQSLQLSSSLEISNILSSQAELCFSISCFKNRKYSENSFGWQWFAFTGTYSEQRPWPWSLRLQL